MADVLPIPAKDGAIFHPIAAVSHYLRRHRKRTAAVVITAFGAAALIHLGSFAISAIAVGGNPTTDAIRAVFRQPSPISAKALALEAASRSPCVMALDRRGKLSVGSDLNRGIVVSLAACDLYNASGDGDSTELTGSSSLTARNIFLSGGYALSAGAIMTAGKSLRTYAAAISDPYAELAIPTYSECTKSNYQLAAERSETISPGVYCGGIAVETGARLKLNPGTYILDRGNFAVNTNGTVSGTGITIILTSSTHSNYGTVDLRAGSMVAIDAPSRGSIVGIPGIAIWVDQHAPTSNNIFDGKDAQGINGIIYLPSQQVQFSGGAPANPSCSQLIALRMTFTGNAYFRHDCTDDRTAYLAPLPPIN
jgi:hypothetical protein